MAQHQASHQELQEMFNNSDTKLKLEKVPLNPSTTTLLCDVSMGAYRPIVPACMRRLVFDTLHSMSHLGINATRQSITSRFVWPHVNHDVGQWSKEYLHCQHNKITRYTSTSPSPIAPASACFDSIHLDLVGPLPVSNGYTYNSDSDRQVHTLARSIPTRRYSG